jgi:putative ABC transport system permease protein
MRAARTSTIAALADMPRVPRRRPVLVALSARLPVPLLIGIRQLARRPRRAVLGALSVTVTVTGVVAILVGSASTHASGGGSIGNLKIERLDELMRIITVMLLILSAINTMFIAWATASDGRFASALQRALGATTRQVTSGLSLAALLPALPAALLGLPLGVGVYHLLDPGDPRTTTPLWGSLAVVIAAPLCVAALTAIPSRLGAQRSPTQTLHGD